MKKRIVILMFSIIMVMMLAGCIFSEDSKETSSSGIMPTTKIEKNEFQILNYSYDEHDSDILKAIFLDKKENVLYCFIKVNRGTSKRSCGEFFMLVDSDGNPFVFDGDINNIPQINFHGESTYGLRPDILTYTFSDSVYNVRYALLFSINNPYGNYIGNVVTLLGGDGKPSIY